MPAAGYRGTQDPSGHADQNQGLSRLDMASLSSLGEINRNGLAQLYRRDYDTYRRRFVPIEDELLDAYDNVGDRREAISTGLADISSSFARSQADLQDQLRSRGLALTPEQQAFQQRRSDFQRGVAEVTSINRTNRRFDERDRGLLTTGVVPQSALSRDANR